MPLKIKPLAVCELFVNTQNGHFCAYAMQFPRANRALAYISPSFLWYFAIFARCQSVLAEQILWLLLAFTSLATHIDRDRMRNETKLSSTSSPKPSEWSKRLDALAHLYLGVSALCVSQGIRRAYGGWVAICLAVTPPPPLLWLVDLQFVRTIGLLLFTTIDIFLQSKGGTNVHNASFVLFLYALRLYVQPKTSVGQRHQTWRGFGAALLLSKQIDDAKWWMER